MLQWHGCVCSVMSPDGYNKRSEGGCDRNAPRPSPCPHARAPREESAVAGAEDGWLLRISPRSYKPRGTLPPMPAQT